MSDEDRRMKDKLTSNSPEPPIGTVVRDDLGRLWRRWANAHGDGAYWLREDVEDDPESWTKVAGNYGPVTVQKDNV